MRVCFIGDSHLACIRQAWDSEAADRPDIAATFFALPGKRIASLDVRSGALSSGDARITDILEFVSGGKDRIDGTYDVYVLHGMHLNVGSALEPCRAGTRKGVRWPQFIVSPEFRSLLRDAIEASIAIATLRKLREISSARVLVSPTPVADTSFPDLRARMTRAGVTGSLSAAFHEVCDLVCREHSARFVPQAPQTLTDDGLATKPEYSIGPARFHEKNVETDNLHMNKDYGAAVLGAILENLSSFDQSAATSAAL